MKKQKTLSTIRDEMAEAKTSKKEFLEKMESLIPWDDFLGIIRPYYYEGVYGNKPYDLELMLRIYILQNLYDLADMKAMNEIIDSRAFSGFCGVDSPNQVPNRDTIGRFRNYLKNTNCRKRYLQKLLKYLKKKD